MISVRMGRLDEAGTEGVICPVRSDFTGLTAAGRRIEVRAGPKVRERLQGMGDLPVGGAVVTPGGDLGSAFIIHAVIESPEDPTTAMGIQRALLNALRRAREWEMESVALPPVGLGVGTLETEDAAHLLVEMLRDHLAEGGPPADVVIVVENAFEEDLFRRLLAGDRS